MSKRGNHNTLLLHLTQVDHFATFTYPRFSMIVEVHTIQLADRTGCYIHFRWSTWIHCLLHHEEAGFGFIIAHVISPYVIPLDNDMFQCWNVRGNAMTTSVLGAVAAGLMLFALPASPGSRSSV